MRIFTYDGREFPDPDPKMTPEEVRQSLCTFFAELHNADVKEVKRGEDTVFEMTKRVGTKGRSILSKKETPTNCKFGKCHWNTIPPGENSQECVACGGNKKCGWKPKR